MLLEIGDDSKNFRKKFKKYAAIIAAAILQSY